MKLADGLLAEHRIERDQFINVDRFEFQFCSGPLNGWLRDVTKMFLQCVQDHEGSTALFGIMRNEFVNFRSERSRNLKGGGRRAAHRSHSPMTKSIEPRIETTSLII